jgi:hypothetical protein
MLARTGRRHDAAPWPAHKEIEVSAANPRRDQALANYQAIQQHHFHSTVEKAMGELLVALAEEPAAPTSPAELAEIRGELAALRRDLAASRSAPSVAIEPAELAEIRKELTALRRDLMFVSSLDPAASPPGTEVAELRQEIAGLRKEMARFMRQNTLGVVAPPDRGAYRPAPRDLPGGPAPMRPVEELLDEVPQIEGELPPEQLKAYVERPRVRPEDITLTAEDIKRQERRALLPVSGETFARLGRQRQPASQANNAAGVILLISFALIMMLMCWAMLAGSL